MQTHVHLKKLGNKKHLRNVGPIRHCERQQHAPFTRCRYSRLRIDVHNDDDNNNDNA